MAPRTIFLSRLLGLWAVIVAIPMMLRTAAMVDIVSDLSHAPGLLFITGVFTVLAGLALVLTHNVWSGGTTQVVVTVVGWVILIKGIALIFISPGGAAVVLDTSHFAEYARFYAAIPLILGLYLTYAGFFEDRAKPP